MRRNNQILRYKVQGAGRKQIREIFSRYRYGLEPFDLDVADAAFLHVENSVSAIFEFKVIAGLGNPLQMLQDETSERLKPLVTRDAEFVLRLQIADIRSAVQHHG